MQQMLNKENQVAVYHSEKIEYPKTAFNPPEQYPEHPFKETDPENQIYPAVRESLRLLGMDSKNYGTKNWNPLGELISPGDRVVIKPNLVLHKSRLEGGDLFSVIVHPSVLRPIIDYVYVALKGRGRITVADSPLQTADFEKLLDVSRLSDMIKYLREKIDVEVLDLRQERAIPDEYGVIDRRIKQSGDPRGYITVDLKGESGLYPVIDDYERFWVTNYDLRSLREHHNPQVNEYLISKTVLDADVFISVPKLKTHRKVGATLSLKNAVGIIGDKSWLPHHRRGTPSERGDEFPKKPPTLMTIKSRTADLLRRERFFGVRLLRAYTQMKNIVSPKKRPRCDVITEGDWYGNDTAWRMALDVNKILFYADRKGRMQKTKQRRYLSLIDGIVAGEGEGPLQPTPKHCGVFVAGYNPAATDAAAARVMGFDYKKIPLIKNAFKMKDHPLTTYNPSDITINSNKAYLREIFKDASNIPFKFVAPHGWVNHIEV